MKKFFLAKVSLVFLCYSGLAEFLPAIDWHDNLIIWLNSFTAWDVIPENVDVTIPIGTGLLVPEPESMS